MGSLYVRERESDDPERRAMMKGDLTD